MTAAFCWWPIPFATATALGVGGLSMGLSVGESYTSPTGVAMLFTEAEAIAPMTAFVVLGYLGLIMFVVAVGGATISTGAGEILAVVTVIVNDLYRGYVNPNASDQKVLGLSPSLPDLDRHIPAGHRYLLAHYRIHILRHVPSHGRRLLLRRRTDLDVLLLQEHQQGRRVLGHHHRRYHRHRVLGSRRRHGPALGCGLGRTSSSWAYRPSSSSLGPSPRRNLSTTSR